MNSDNAVGAKTEDDGDGPEVEHDDLLAELESVKEQCRYKTEEAVGSETPKKNTLGSAISGP